MLNDISLYTLILFQDHLPSFTRMDENEKAPSVAAQLRGWEEARDKTRGKKGKREGDEDEGGRAGEDQHHVPVISDIKKQNPPDHIQTT